MRYPKHKDIAIFRGMLERFVPVDLPLSFGWRKSLNAHPNLRISGQTNQIDWTSDIYGGSFFVTQVGTRLSETHDNPRSAIVYLCRMLGVKPKTQ